MMPRAFSFGYYPRQGAGLMLFVGGMGWIILRAGKSIMKAMKFGYCDSVYSAVAAGIVASTV